MPRATAQLRCAWPNHWPEASDTASASIYTSTQATVIVLTTTTIATATSYCNATAPCWCLCIVQALAALPLAQGAIGRYLFATGPSYRAKGPCPRSRHKGARSSMYHLLLLSSCSKAASAYQAQVSGASHQQTNMLLQAPCSKAAGCCRHMLCLFNPNKTIVSIRFNIVYPPPSGHQMASQKEYESMYHRCFAPRVFCLG